MSKILQNTGGGLLAALQGCSVGINAITSNAAAAAAAAAAATTVVMRCRRC